VSLPFSHDAFLDVFAVYNRTWWPVAVVLWIATLVAIVQLVRDRARGAGLAALLAVHWAWSGVAYHARAFAAINPAAPLFAVLFLVQALAFVWSGVIRGRLAFAWGGSWRHRLAALLLLAAIAYPGVAWVTVNAWPRVPTFGVPCPTTLFTAGCLLAAVPPVPRRLLVIPVLWSLVGGSAALLLGIRIDLMLFVAGAGLSVLVVAPGIAHRHSSAGGARSEP
jgi:hypothetical protein